MTIEMDMTDTDVLVVGGGPVGLAVAGELRRFGIDCQVLEARTRRKEGSRALTLHARTLELLNLRGVIPEFVARGRVVGEISLVTGSNRAVRLRLDELDSPFPFVLVLPQAETEAILERHLGELGGVLRLGERVTGVEPQPDRVVATISGADGIRQVRARWLVAADGAHSTVRQLLDAPVRSGREGMTYYGADVSLDGVDPELQLIWSAGGFGVLVPFRDGTFRVAVTAPDPSGEPAQPTLADIQRQVTRVFPRRLILRDPTWLTVLRSGHRQLIDYRHGRVLFAGDAAHTHNPAGGQGMNIGLHDAFNLGWKLAAVVTADAPEGLLDSYHDERHPAAARVLTQTNRTMRLAHLRSPLLRALRDQVVHQLPAALRRRLVEQVAGLDVNYSPTARRRPGLPGGRRSSILPAGARVPDIALMTPDGRATSLHANLRAGARVELRLADNVLTVAADDRIQTFLDHRRAARRRLGLTDTTVLRIRPDGHVDGTDQQPEVAAASQVGRSEIR
jgi:2-polyprenyl-6-methoxyphenol hydroxylase-like FAD-dependent oxidoreductase